MKHPILEIRIPETCHEDWSNMSPTEKGRFCISCTKEVIDFTAKSDEEIINHISKHGNACGRFYASQLDRKLIADRKKRNHWLSYAASFLLPMTLFSQETTSTQKKTVKTTQLDSLKIKNLHISSLERKATVSSKKQQKSFTVTGTVTDDTGMPLPAASIAIKGTSRGKATDFDGNYSIQVKSGDVLIVSYIGYDSQEIKVNADIFVFDILMIPNNSLEEVVVVGGYWHNDSTSYSSNYCETDEEKARKKRTKNYFTFKRKKWLEKRAQKRAERAARKAKKASKK